MKSPRCLATMIGSLPHKDPREAVELVFKNLPELPVWPELPGRTFWEDMVHAHTHRLPCLVEDEAARKCYIDTGRDCETELAAYYERSMSAEQSGELSEFAMTPRYGSALEATAQRLGQLPEKTAFKVQSIGPVSFQLQLHDQAGRPLYYNETFQDVLARQIRLQSRWLVRKFAPLACEVVAFLDEPALAAFGSSGYLGVSREAVVERLGAAISALKDEGAMVGVHVCGNTDFSMILEAGADILNFDAYEYGGSMLVYFREVQELLSRGGVLAWGIVPTSDKVREESVASLKDRFLGLVNELCAQGLDRELILNQSMLTPACGLGPMSPEDAERAVALLSGLSRSVQDEAG